jgi:predicted TIM-barrel fold metal-dependent hydrolase
MRVIDVDSHFHEPHDWLMHVDPELASELGPPIAFLDTFRATTLPLGPNKDDDPLDRVPPGFLTHLDMTAALQPDNQEQPSDDPFYDADARLRFCDEHGIDVQFLNPTFGMSGVVAAEKLGRSDLVPRARAAYNTWAAGQVHGHTDRLIPVTQIDPSDLGWTVRELTRMREAGSRAFSIGPVPDTSGRSITHPDYEVLWSAAEDLGMTAVAHIGIGRETINNGWAANGRDLTTYSMLQFMTMPQLTGPLVVGAMVLDGVFERHPKLVLLTEELGFDWLPKLLSDLDRFTASSTLAGDSYRLPLAPSEYIRRQVRASPLAQFEPLHPTFDLLPEVLVCFATDYPHLEGCADAVEVCTKQLTEDGADVQERFFGGVAELLGV